MTAAIQWSGEAIEAALAAQGIGLAPGRGERIARGQQALLDAVTADGSRAELPFEAEPASFGAALLRCSVK